MRKTSLLFITFLSSLFLFTPDLLAADSNIVNCCVRKNDGERAIQGCYQYTQKYCNSYNKSVTGLYRSTIVSSCDSCVPATEQKEYVPCCVRNKTSNEVLECNNYRTRSECAAISNYTSGSLSGYFGTVVSSCGSCTKSAPSEDEDDVETTVRCCVRKKAGDSFVACHADYTRTECEGLSAGSSGNKGSVVSTCGECTPTPPKEPEGGFNYILNLENLSASQLDAINPLGLSNVFNNKANRTPGFIINRLLKAIIFPIAGFLLFLMIVWGGFQVVNGSVTGNQSIIDLGKRKVTGSIIGFLLLFGSYWLWSIVEIALGLGTVA